VKVLLGAVCVVGSMFFVFRVAGCAALAGLEALRYEPGDTAGRDANDGEASETPASDACAPRPRRSSVAVYRARERRFYWRSAIDGGGEQMAEVADVADGGVVEALVGDWAGLGRSGVAIFDPVTSTAFLWNVPPTGPDVPPAEQRRVEGYVAGCQLVSGRFSPCAPDTIGVCCPISAGGGVGTTNSCTLLAANDLRRFDFGTGGDRIFFGDWDGDGVDSPAVYRSSNGRTFFRNANDGGFGEDGPSFQPGDAGTPLGADVFDEGASAFGLRTGNQFLFVSRSGAVRTVTLGDAGDVPFAGAL